MKHPTMCGVCGKTEENADYDSYDSHTARFRIEEHYDGKEIDMEIVIVSSLDLCFSCVKKIINGEWKAMGGG